MLIWDRWGYAGQLIGLAAGRLVMEPNFLVWPACLPASLASSGHRTSYTQPSFSASQSVLAAMSTWPLSTPCRAHVGSAWCRLCQDSPNDSIASQETFLD